MEEEKKDDVVEYLEPPQLGTEADRERIVTISLDAEENEFELADNELDESGQGMQIEQYLDFDEQPQEQAEKAKVVWFGHEQNIKQKQE